MVKSDVKSMFDYLHSNIQRINDSKVFAGLMIITLNIVSKYVNIGLSKSMESYLKYTFSRQLLVFSIAWMGTRDIYIAFFITFVFAICTEYLFNEDSVFCVLSEDFQDYHTTLIDNDVANSDKVTDDDVQKAKDILEKAKKQNKLRDDNFEGFSMK
tara:strand:- start:849 stop:1316 length:468 start_codon:yes stop_codon:yes gene_type:complete